MHSTGTINEKNKVASKKELKALLVEAEVKWTESCKTVCFSLHSYEDALDEEKKNLSQVKHLKYMLEKLEKEK